MRLLINATGNTISDLEDALDEVKRLVSNGFLTGFDKNEFGSYQFDRFGMALETDAKQEGRTS